MLYHPISRYLHQLRPGSSPHTLQRTLAVPTIPFNPIPDLSFTVTLPVLLLLRIRWTIVAPALQQNTHAITPVRFIHEPALVAGVHDFALDAVDDAQGDEEVVPVVREVLARVVEAEGG